MKFFRQTSKQYLFLWSVILILSLLCSQGMVLHVHSLDHGHDEYLENSHLSKAHSAYNLSHSEHHNGAVYEVASPDGLLKNIADILFVFILFIIPFALVLNMPLLTQVFHRYRKRKLVLYERHLISPPLRAPPLLSHIN